MYRINYISQWSGKRGRGVILGYFPCSREISLQEVESLLEHPFPARNRADIYQRLLCIVPETEDEREKILHVVSNYMQKRWGKVDVPQPLVPKVGGPPG